MLEEKEFNQPVKDTRQEMDFGPDKKPIQPDYQGTVNKLNKEHGLSADKGFRVAKTTDPAFSGTNIQHPTGRNMTPNELEYAMKNGSLKGYKELADKREQAMRASSPIKRLKELEKESKPQVDELSDDELKEELYDNEYWYGNAKNVDDVAKALVDRTKISPERAKAFASKYWKGENTWSPEEKDYDPSNRDQSTEHHNAIIDEINNRYEKGEIDRFQYRAAINEEVERWNDEQYQWWDVNPQREERFNKKDELVQKYREMGYDPATAQLKAERDIVEEEESYPKGTSKAYTDKVNAEYQKALPILEQYGIKLDDFGGRPSKQGGYEDNTKAIMDKYVFGPFRQMYPNGNNEAWNRDYKELYDAIQAVEDKNYNDWWIKSKGGKIIEKKTKETPLVEKEFDEELGEFVDWNPIPTEPGKTIKYKPYLAKISGFDINQMPPIRAKTLNNGLAIETKAQPKDRIYHGSIGKYRMVDVETGTMVGWAKDYEDALNKSNDQDFIGAINRAKEVFKRRRAEQYYRKKNPTLSDRLEEDLED